MAKYFYEYLFLGTFIRSLLALIMWLVIVITIVLALSSDISLKAQNMTVNNDITAMVEVSNSIL